MLKYTDKLFANFGKRVTSGLVGVALAFALHGTPAGNFISDKMNQYILGKDGGYSQNFDISELYEQREPQEFPGIEAYRTTATGERIEIPTIPFDRPLFFP